MRGEERVRNEMWKMVLLTELKVNEDGVVWLGEDEERVVLVRGRRIVIPVVASMCRKRKLFSKKCVNEMQLRRL